MDLSTHDASYLDLATRAGLPLATADAALRRAAEKVQIELMAAGWRLESRRQS